MDVMCVFHEMLVMGTVAIIAMCLLLFASMVTHDRREMKSKLKKKHDEGR